MHTLLKLTTGDIHLYVRDKEGIDSLIASSDKSDTSIHDLNVESCEQLLSDVDSNVSVPVRIQGFSEDGEIIVAKRFVEDEPVH